MTGSSQRQGSHKAYQRASHTVSKTRQVVMLYDGAIRFLQQARDHMVAGEIEARYHKLVRVGEIIMALQSCLDFEQGGEPAKVLYDFYALADTRILSMHRTGSVETCDQVIRDLKAMRDVWEVIDRGESAGHSGTTPESTGQDLPLDTPKDPITFSA